MGVLNLLYHPDTVLTAADIEILAEGLLEEIPIPGVKGCGFDSGIIHDGSGLLTAWWSVPVVPPCQRDQLLVFQPGAGP